MTRKFWIASVVVCSLTLAAACGNQSPSPASPSAAVPGDTQANADGSTLKATPPTAVSPINGQKPDFVKLVINNSSVKFASNIPLTYRFEIYNAGGTRVYQSSAVPAGQGQTSHEPAASLEGDQTYQWQARPEYLGIAGPWSSRASFVAPVNVGYIRGSEVYDPLIAGKTIGKIHGDVSFIPGVGVQLHNFESYISYDLEQTLLEGEFSVLTTNVIYNTKGNKTKIMAMGQGYDDIVTNDRRMTVEKRGDPPGVVAWRFITHDDQVDTEGPERVALPFDERQTYFWKATWFGNFFNVVINEGGVNGPDIYDMGKPFHGRPYDPSPHVAFLGAPVGRSGPEGASVPGVIYRQVWISSRPRPAFANK